MTHSHIAKCSKSASGNHLYYKAKDFSYKEVASGNKTAVAVMKHGKRICKLCGFEHPSRQGD